MVNNIIKNPTDPKFKVIKRSNKTIQEKLFSLKPQESLQMLIEVLGYVHNQSDDSFEWVGDNLVILKRGAYFIDEIVKKTSLLKPMTEEEV